MINHELLGDNSGNKIPNVSEIIVVGRYAQLTRDKENFIQDTLKSIHKYNLPLKKVMEDGIARHKNYGSHFKDLFCFTYGCLTAAYESSGLSIPRISEAVIASDYKEFPPERPLTPEDRELADIKSAPYFFRISVENSYLMHQVAQLVMKEFQIHSGQNADSDPLSEQNLDINIIKERTEAITKIADAKNDAFLTLYRLFIKASD